YPPIDPTPQLSDLLDKTMRDLKLLNPTRHAVEEQRQFRQAYHLIAPKTPPPPPLYSKRALFSPIAPPTISQPEQKPSPPYASHAEQESEREILPPRKTNGSSPSQQQCPDPCPDSINHGNSIQGKRA